jgi:hypothetical protein
MNRCPGDLRGGWRGQTARTLTECSRLAAASRQPVRRVRRRDTASTVRVRSADARRSTSGLPVRRCARAATTRRSTVRWPAEEASDRSRRLRYDLRIDTVKESPDAAAQLLAELVQRRYGRTPQLPIGAAAHRIGQSGGAKPAEAPAAGRTPDVPICSPCCADR